MPFGTELEGVTKHIFTKVSANSQIANFVGTHPTGNVPQIYFGKAPEGARLPYFVYTYLGGQAKTLNSGRKIMKRLKFSMSFVTPGDSILNVMDKMGHLENLFQADQMSENIVIIGSRIESDFTFPEILDGGVKVNRTGIIVSIMAYPQNQSQI